MWQSDRDIQFQYTQQLLGGYLELRGLMTTSQECAIMHIVQRLGEQSVKDVQQAAEQGRCRYWAESLLIECMLLCLVKTTNPPFSLFNQKEDLISGPSGDSKKVTGAPGGKCANWRHPCSLPLDSKVYEPPVSYQYRRRKSREYGVGLGFHYPVAYLPRTGIDPALFEHKS